ncbi:hypothetical protein WMF26_34130 [Sorangium sp. So ce185]|uniref:hypothetical protein n=1 Tax=Sorangium sp. So ce185 TaxID=3133287 RepID=UPI003F5DB838
MTSDATTIVLAEAGRIVPVDGALEELALTDDRHQAPGAAMGEQNPTGLETSAPSCGPALGTASVSERFRDDGANAVIAEVVQTTEASLRAARLPNQGQAKGYPSSQMLTVTSTMSIPIDKTAGILESGTDRGWRRSSGATRQEGRT